MTACHMNFYAKDSGSVLCPAFCEEGVWLKHSRKYVTDAMRALSRRRDYSAECFNRMIAEANAAGFLVSLNHPVWSLQNYSDYCGMKGLWGDVRWPDFRTLFSRLMTFCASDSTCFRFRRTTDISCKIVFMVTSW